VRLLVNQSNTLTKPKMTDSIKFENHRKSLAISNIVMKQMLAV